MFLLNLNKIPTEGEVMEKKGHEDREEVVKMILEICNGIDNDPKVRGEAEEYPKKYGALTEEELRRIITI